MAVHSGGGGVGDDSEEDDDIVLGVQEDFRRHIDALKRACVLEVGHGGYISTPASILSTDAPAHEEEDEDEDEEDDDALLQSIQKKYGARLGGDPASNHEKGLTLLDEEEGDEEEDDDEILRTVALYVKEKRAVQPKVASPSKDDDETEEHRSSAPQASSVGENARVSCGPDNDDIGNEPAQEAGRSISSFLPGNWTDSDGDVELSGSSPGVPQGRGLIRDQDGSTSSALAEIGEVTLSRSIEKVADALKKNRNYQRTLKNVLSQIEEKRNENTELQKRVRALVDFEKYCGRRFSGFFADQANPSVKLIARGPALHSKSAEAYDKAVSDIPMCGPPENPDVEKYKYIQQKLSFTFVNRRWNNEQRMKLAKGVTQQVYEVLVRQAMDAASNSEAMDDQLDNFDDQRDTLDEHLAEIKRKKLTASEIREALPMINWAEVARVYVVGRTPEDCRTRWMNEEDTLINKSPWNKIEDKRLLRIAQNQDFCHWEKIAQRLGTNRTPAECLTRYQRSLNASILRRDWTPEEDEQLRAAVEELGENNWSAVSGCLEGRSNSQCLMRWYKVLHPGKQKRGRWSVEEDKRLKWAVSVYGPKKWRQIAGHVPGRTDLQCRERWCNVLDPSIKLGEWTEEEDRKLEASVATHGPHHWAAVANDLKIRTDSQCCRRWKALHPEDQLAFQRNVHIRRTALAGNFQGRKKERPRLGPQDFTAKSIDENMSPRECRAARILKRKLARANQAFRGKSSSAPAALVLVNPAELRILEQGEEAVGSVSSAQLGESRNTEADQSASVGGSRRRNSQKARGSNPRATARLSAQDFRELNPFGQQASSFVDLVRSIQTYCTSSRLAAGEEDRSALQSFSETYRRGVDPTAEAADGRDDLCFRENPERGSGLPSSFLDGQSIRECEISRELEHELDAGVITESGDDHSRLLPDSTQDGQVSGLSQSLTVDFRPDVDNTVGMEYDPIGRTGGTGSIGIPSDGESDRPGLSVGNGRVSCPIQSDSLHRFGGRMDVWFPTPGQQTDGDSSCPAGSAFLDHDSQLSREDEEVAAATKVVLSWPFFSGVQELWSRDTKFLGSKPRRKHPEKAEEKHAFCVLTVPVVRKPRSALPVRKRRTLSVAKSVPLAPTPSPAELPA